MIFNKLFAEHLIGARLLPTETVDRVLALAEKNITPLARELIRDGCLSEEAVMSALADCLGLEYRLVQVTELNIPLVHRFPRERLIEYKTIPFREYGDQIVMLASDPLFFEDIRALRYHTDKEPIFVLTLPSQMDKLLDYAGNKIRQTTVLEDYASAEKDITGTAPNEAELDAPVIKLVDSILKEAVDRGASDIHVEPFEKKILIRFRIDGNLVKIDEIPTHLYDALLARIKIISNLNIAERRVPQDGKIGLVMNERSYDFRVSTIPTLHGEKVVIRIYNIGLSGTDITALGFSEEEEGLIREMITRPHGILLLTGPTGSGKSTTLYTFLRNLNREETNIITVEDPVENEIDGINQVQVNPKANLTFGTALRSILRQDPNVIMIGEIRDEETAQIATRAAITGHLVLSSIHTNSAAGVVTRLINMGIPKYLVVDSLLGAISQRLVRRLCPRCRREKIADAAEMKMLRLEGKTRIWEPVGCSYCSHTGYLGRIGVFEIMVVSEEVKALVMRDDFSSDRLSLHLSTRMVPLIEAARRRVLEGETTVEEYEKLTDLVDK